MKFSVGDPVYVTSNNEEGVIVEIIDKQTAKVKVGQAQFHVFFEDLEHPYLRWFVKKNQSTKTNKIFVDQIQKDKSYKRESLLIPGVHLVFFPQYKLDVFDEVVDKVKIFLYNETDEDYTFNYQAKNRNELFFEIDNRLLPNSSFYIHDLIFDLFANGPLFTYKFIDNSNPKLELESFVALKPKKMFEYLEKIKYENHAFFSISLFEKIVAKPSTSVDIKDFAIKNVSNAKKNHFDFTNAMQNSKYEIDLHIEKLVKNPNSLSSGEILTIQLKEFENALELASITHQRSVVFIHGVGKGTLKAAIHKILSVKMQKKTIQTFVNNYDSRYGYGATEVFF